MVKLTLGKEPLFNQCYIEEKEIEYFPSSNSSSNDIR